MLRFLMILSLSLVFFQTSTAIAKEGGYRPSARSAQRILFEDDGLYGYRDGYGRTVIAPRYFMAEDFDPRSGLAAVVQGADWVLIDRSGAVRLRPFVFDNGPDPFRNGLARLVENARIGFFDTSGHIVVPPRYSFAWPFENGVAAVCDGCRRVPMGEVHRIEGGRWGLIDTRGRQVEPLVHPSAERARARGQKSR